ncbi:molybdate ABC transporter substrate-binding protein [Tessaracoccus oleiagri]|uniref:Molybdate transport system substrate-binding protein n=1 Tax=Tessaracoccus oleiagri TaxID=686624 RepID=A0A1G9I7I9_9ACTN|nr:molybdate ABC transporter substrate-binding protein [Tessaracoccus oleiagri]SDL21237.1 molybdate transport system substrate-binding protein [Tessaracoccus oleiagri]
MRRVLAAALAALALAACSEDRAEPTTVFAASSLTIPFEEIAEDREVSFSFDGSSGLVDQLAGGAPADVLATADQRTMDRAVELGLVEGEPTMFATNRLVLVTPPDNPAGVTGLDGSLDGAKLVVCAPEVPCGDASARLAERAGVELDPVSEETKVTDVLGKVIAGEADAGLVYFTDARGAGDEVHVIEMPEATEEPNTYWIAAVAGGDPERAAGFIRLVGNSGPVLERHGFGPRA